MQCLYCGNPVAAYRGLPGESFCSDEHARLYGAASPAANYLFLLGVPTPVSAVPASGPARAAPLHPTSLPDVKFPGGIERPAALALPAGPRIPPERRPDPAAPASCAAVAAALAPRVQLELPRLMAAPERPEKAAAPHTQVWRGLRAHAGGWKLAVAFAALLLILAGIRMRHPEARRAAHAAATRALARGWGEMKGDIQERAAVLLYDDFRGGLADWRTRGEFAPSWSYDAAGFVRPGALALYRPTLGLADYSVEFLAQIEAHPLGIAFRALDWKNYYALKLAIANSGSSSVIDLTRYTVARGREIARATRRLPLPVTGLTVYRIRLETRGSDFTLMVQGRVADYWSDSRFKRGGIGFFGGNGERPRLSWVEVSHQYDPLGRLCALLTPAGSRPIGH